MKNSPIKMVDSSVLAETDDKYVKDDANLQFWIDRYLKSNDNISINTFNSRMHDLQLLASFASSRNISRVDQIYLNTLKAYFVTLNKNNSTLATRRAFSTMTQFFNFLITAGAIQCTQDPFRHLKLTNFRIRIMRTRPASVGTDKNDKEVYQRILSSAKELLNTPRKHKYRNYAIVMFLLHHGLFPTQLVNIKMDQLDINTSTNEGIIHNTSEGRIKSAYDIVLAKEVVEALRMYIDKERRPCSEYIFNTCRGSKMTRNRIFQIFKELPGLATPGATKLNASAIPSLRALRNMTVHKMQVGLSAIDIARNVKCPTLPCM